MSAELSLFWTGILTHVWQTSLFIALLWAVERAMGLAPGRWVERLWLLGLLRLLWPSGLTLPGFEMASRGGYETAQKILTLPAQVVQTSTTPSGFSVFLMVISGMWIVGVLIHLLRLGQDQRNLQHWKSHPFEEMPLADQTVLGSSMAKLDLVPDQVRWTDSSVMPMVVGLIRPRIILPLSLIHQLAGDQLLAVLSHENSHRLRYDPLRLLGYSLVQSVFFFHPLWPLVLKRLKDSSEFIADESSLASGLPGRRYALALATALDLDLKTPRLSAAAGLRCKTSLTSRIARFNLKERNMNMLRYRFLLAMAFGLLILGMLAPVGNQAVALTGDEPESNTTVIGGGRPEPEDKDVRVNITRWAKPEYPDACRKEKISGTVVVKALVDKEGQIAKAEVLDGPECLREAALEAAKKCLFKPATKNGVQVEAWVAIPYEFRLK